MRPDNHLQCYADAYRLFKNADGVVEIDTRFKSRDGLRVSVYPFSDSHLAVLLPPGAGRNLMRRCPDVFNIHQRGLDGMVLVFMEDRLHDLAGVLRLRRRRRLSEAGRQRLVEVGQNSRFVTA